MERILCAAIWLKDYPTSVHNARNLESGVVLCGWRHHNIVSQINTLLGKKMYEIGEYEQGFISSEGNFYDREKAISFFGGVGWLASIFIILIALKIIHP